MADTKTADQWKQVAGKLDSQIGELEKQQNQLQDKIQTLRQQQVQLNGKIGGLPIGPDRTAANQQYGELTRQIKELENQNGQLSQQIQRLDVELQAAERQTDIAQDSPPGTAANPVTSSNPPPANPNPGNNTDVPPTNDTQFALANAEPQQPTPEEYLGSFTNPEVAPPTSQDVIDAEEDPFERARLEVIQRDKPPPTEQDVIDAEEDPFERARLNVQQRATAPPITQEEIQDRLKDDPAYRDELNTQSQAQLEFGPGIGGGTTATTNPSQDIGTKQARASGGNVNESPFPAVPDWRVRLTLAPGAQYLYNIAGPKDILYPLKGKGVIFPYVPQISVSYNATYAATDLPHSNYKIYNYMSSSVEAIQITADFTAQDIYEANYLLAVIHFFKSVTKMFYGNDSNPIRGMPPPLCYLSGHGEYGFDNHPVVVQTFSLTYPNDVDYINAGEASNVPLLPVYNPRGVTSSSSAARLSGSGLAAGGGAAAKTGTQSAKNPGSTRVPTKIQLQITCLPIVTRNNISNKFSLKEYATGSLLKGSTRAGGGIW